MRQAAIRVGALGKGALLAKLDLQSAYRQISVHHADQRLLGIRWCDQVFRDHALPFRLRSAPKLFSAIADALAWALSCEGVSNSTHYLDDFLFWSERDSPDCARNLQVASRVCQSLGLPPAPSKTEGPTTKLTFLGIEFDTIKQELRLPQSKLLRLKSTLHQWSSTRNPTKRQLQSLIGILKHAASVIRPGHLFTRNLIENMKRPKGLEQRTRLTHAAKADIAWWQLIAEDWNGVSFFPGSLHLTPHSPRVVSDASGSWGCGAFLAASGVWLQIPWPPEWLERDIAQKELVPIVAAAALWGHEWSRQVVVFKCDNMAVVHSLNEMSARDPNLNRLLTLFFIKAQFQFEHKALHIAGRDNTAADALSRDKVNTFLSLLPQAPKTTSPCPPSLQELLFDPRLSWTSPSWRTLLKSCLLTGSQAEPEPHTPQHKNDISTFVPPMTYLLSLFPNIHLHCFPPFLRIKVSNPNPSPPIYRPSATSKSQPV